MRYKILSLLLFIKSIVLANTQSYAPANSAPYFTNTWYWRMYENEPVGSRPRDATSEEMIVLRAWDLEDDDLTFEVKGQIGEKYFTVDSKTGVVKLRKPFDREIDDRYKVKFSVSDGINEVEKEAYIRIIDVNDNPPLFDSPPYTATIMEGARVGAEVMTIVASDPDKGFGGIIRYDIVQSADASGLIPFELNADTGVLTTTNIIDYEEADTYKIIVQASDQDARNPLTSTTTVLINIQDVQDSEPEFKNLPYDRAIDEDIALGTSVVRVLAVDGDRGSPNEIVYSLVSGNRDGKFLLDTTAGDVRVASPIDRDVAGFEEKYTLTVRATEKTPHLASMWGAFRETSFDVTVNDVNDERPRFERREVRFSVSESTPVGVPLPTRIRVTDNDQGPNSDVTLSVGWRNNDVITVSPVTFRKETLLTLILKEPLDYETQTKLQFKVFANETNDLSLFSTCDVIIDVENENDNAPQFLEENYFVNVSESEPVDFPILTVSARDADDGRLGRISYSVEGARGEISIGKRSGKINLLKKLDYETRKQKQYTIVATDSGSYPRSTKTTLTINVIDHNDNTPRFERTRYEVAVTENTVENGILSVKATDEDSYPNNYLTYVIEKGEYSNHFAIDTVEQRGIINLIEPFDFEEVQTIELTLEVVDSGFLASTATLVVTINDVNDNNPAFILISNFTVEENIGGGVLVGRVAAVDPDSNKNGDVSYYVTEGEDQFGTIFRLDEKNGNIKTKPGTSPDYETKAYYDVTITAQDNGNPPRSAEKNVRITVTDLNDNSPIFTKSNYDVTVNENNALENMPVTATDEDNGSNGEIKYSIVSGNTNLFRINPHSGIIRSSRPLDFERLGDHVTLTIKAEDGGDVTREATATVTINIVDINDNHPMFLPGTKTQYEVLENVDGANIATFQADDADSGNNGEVVYEIVKGNELGKFSISHQGGKLRVSSGTELDREYQNIYNLTIMAVDLGSNPKNATIDVAIKVIDVNDNTPEFQRFPDRISLSEKTAVGSIVARLNARDVDEERFGDVTFSMQNVGDVFEINENTGVIYLAKPLDRETTSEYNLFVTIRDNPKNRRNSRSLTKTLIVYVDDINDEKPRFIGKLPYTATVDENSPPGTQIQFLGTPLLAKDMDGGENAVLTYFIQSQDATSSLFTIDSSGNIYTTESLDRENLSSDVIDLVIRATDVGGLYTDAVVRVTIGDVNDNSPRFRARRMKTNILESAQSGHVVARMTASDPDKGKNGEIFYRIQSGSFDKFQIGADTGVLYLSPGQSLDRETTSQYRLKVIASDKSSAHGRSSTATVIVTVDDVNDSRPKFTNGQQKILIYENSPVGSDVVQLVAIDNDLEPDLVYSISSVTIFDAQGQPLMVEASPNDVMQSDNDVILSWFSLNATTGKVVLGSKDSDTTTVDRELCSRIVIRFSVRDENASSQEVKTSSEDMIVQIDIVDQNDNSPVFDIPFDDDVTITEDGLVVDVMEEVEVGTRVLKVKATDKDQGLNGKVRFELQGKIKGKLKLKSENSGVVVTSSRLDRERLMTSDNSAWLNFTIIARDLGFPAGRSTRLPVFLRINDVNDHSPVFDEASYDTHIPENRKIGTILTTVSATDIDQGDFGDVTYSLFGEFGNFKINPQTGVITLAKKLDREAADEYIFTVVAADNVRGAFGNRRQETKQVKVTLGDVNDNSPVFIRPKQTTIQVRENAAPGTMVTNVTAVDDDVGSNGHVTYSIDAFQDVFAIDPYNGDVTVSRPITLSPSRPTFGDVTITATDGGGRATNMTLQVSIVDVNNHVPTFIQPESNVIKIKEEQPGGLQVTQVLAVDDDIGLNGVVRYSIHDPDFTDQGAFFIDDITGRIVTSRRLDRELQHTYTLVVKAHDLGSPSLQSSRIITVIVDDINDNRPTFPGSDKEGGATQVINTPEDAKVGSTIGHVTRATDRDHRARIYYHILSRDDDVTQMFGIIKNRIVLRKSLDREATNRYVLIIGATNNENYTRPFMVGQWDGSTVPLPSAMISNQIQVPIDIIWDPANDKSLLRVTIRVTDVFDEKPMFRHDQYSTAVEANAKQDTVIAQINATDNDLNDILKYKIISSKYFLKEESRGIEENWFHMNEENGLITTATQLQKPKGMYDLTILASDLANLTTTTTLTIHIRRQSKQLQFVLDSPPDVVLEQREKFTEILQNATDSIVTIDDVRQHVKSDNQIDVAKSDVIIRVFDTKGSDKGALAKMISGSSNLKKLFSDYSFYEVTEITETNGDDIFALQLIIAILVTVLIFIIVISILFLIRMRQYYRIKMEKLKESQTDVTPEQPENIDGVWKERKLSKTTSKSSHFDEIPESESTKTEHKLRKSNMISSGNVKRSYTTAPTLASTLLWSPSNVRRTTRSADVIEAPEINTSDVFEYDITLHATGCEKPITALHGSESGSSF